MNKKFEKLGFYPANILMPKGQDMHKWAVVACDQFTSEPEYWQAVECEARNPCIHDRNDIKSAGSFLNRDFLFLRQLR